ncbi:hypothetical protein B0T16DRAFT_446940 [Cercophora newfieldiana]|uniref:Uncharacterized protein n=1 Tax=Cercophora newfieldiana TaxID=92897 RepID=A0AA39Y919_9PEZI|nr:hypothetical protein B0T16DRAFT_446940 [Cercophora newfieldiana]
MAEIPLFKRIRMVTTADLTACYALVAAYIQNPAAANSVTELIIDLHTDGRYPYTRLSRPPFILIASPSAFDDNVHDSIIKHATALGLGDEAISVMLRALERKKRNLSQHERERSSNAEPEPKRARWESSSHSVFDYNSTITTLLISLLPNITTFRFFEVDRDDMKQFHCFYRLPSVRTVLLEGLEDYHASHRDPPPQKSSQITKVHSRHSDISGGMVAAIVEMPKKLEALEYSAFRLMSTDGEEVEDGARKREGKDGNEDRDGGKRGANGYPPGSIGRLDNFDALAHLSIRIGLLLGYDDAFIDHKQLVPSANYRLVEALPPNLESLRLYGYRKGENSVIDSHVTELLERKSELFPDLVDIEGIDKFIPDSRWIGAASWSIQFLAPFNDWAPFHVIHFIYFSVIFSFISRGSQRSGTVMMRPLVFIPLVPAAFAQASSLIFPPIVSYTLDEVINATRDGWDTAFTDINATGSATIPGKNVRLPFPGGTSSDWKYTISVRDDVPHAPPVSGFFTATWLQLEAPKEVLVSKKINDTREVQVVETATDNSWDVCMYVFQSWDMFHNEAVSQGCEGFWVDAAGCAKGLEQNLVASFGKEEVEVETKDGMRKTRCTPPGPDLVPPNCLGVDAGSLITLDMPMDVLDTDSSWLGKGNFGFAKFSDAGDVHEKGNTTAYDLARKRAFVVAHVWGSRGHGEARAEASVRCLQANGGPKQMSVSEGVRFKFSPWLL